MDTLTSMAVFVEVVERGSFAAAASSFSLSTTMVANHVRALEARLGVRLLERTTRRHRLTDVGAAYLERCRDVLASAEAAERVVEELHAVPRGTLRVTSPVSYGAHRLVPVIAAYMKRYPEVQVELHLIDRVVDLAEEGFDVAIRSGDLGHSAADLVAQPLLPSRMYLVAAPAYLRRRGKPKKPEDLTLHDCLGFTAWKKPYEWRFTRKGETIHVKIGGSFVSNNGQALLSAALQGAGVIAQADVLLDEPIRNGSLTRLLPQWELPERAIHILRRANARPGAKLRTFIDFVSAHLGNASARPPTSP
jgi:DNA-binding transcriptional LysR family regulator